MQTKAFYESKTVIFNIVMTIILAVPIIAAAYKALSPEEAVLIDSVAGLITGLGNIVLRVWFTDTGIESRGAKEAKQAVVDRAYTFGKQWH